MYPFAEGQTLTLQRRLLILLLLSAPLVWGAGLLFGLSNAGLEINELFDTQQIRLARQVLSTLPSASLDVVPATAAAPSSPGSLGDGDLDDLSIAVWNRQGQLLLVDREGVLLPVRHGAEGFADLTLDGEVWRTYYLPAASGEWLVAVGQKQDERDELVWSLLAGQLVPWVLTLPVLLLVMAAAVRQALKPVRALTAEIDRRGAGELQPLAATNELPTDLKPLLQAMNTLLARIDDSHERERRFIADAAHELRTPLAALQAQWDAQRLQAPAVACTKPQPQTPAEPPDKIAQGLARMGRLVAQLLSLSRLDQPAQAGAQQAVDWPAMVERLFGELLPLADRAGVELECVWPPAGDKALALQGDSELIAAMLRNLLDNALHHSARGQTVSLRLLHDRIEVIDDGPGVADEHLARLGERFFRLPGQSEPGSGLGLSIASRIAALHGLRLSFANRGGEPASQRGFVVRLSR
jgi:two-component system, OmpR family, sensor histidine kinase QseC